jgi:hypothetical protein
LLAACGGSGASSASEKALQRQADLYAIDLMMSLWAPNATYTVGPGETYVGKQEIRRFWLKAPVFNPKNHWVSETPAYKIRITVSGDRGTLYFECHYVVPKTGKVIKTAGADQQVARIGGRWLVTNHIGASPALTP